MNSTLKSLLFWIVLVVVGVLIWNFSTTFQTREKTIPFSEFVKQLDDTQVQKVVLTGNEVLFTSKAGEKYRTYAPPQYEGLGNKLIERNVEITAKEPTTSPWAALLYAWAPILLMIGFWIFIMRQMQSGGNKALSFGKSRAKLSSSSQKKGPFPLTLAGVEPGRKRVLIVEDWAEIRRLRRSEGVSISEIARVMGCSRNTVKAALASGWSAEV